MIKIDNALSFADLQEPLNDFWQLSGEKILQIEAAFDTTQGVPVFTKQGRYTSRGWTEWTQGFQYGSAILQFEATGDETFLEIGRKNTLDKMAIHLSHIGVHDHGFNNISTYGNLLRLMVEEKIPRNTWEQHFYELALKVSAATQASRWTQIQGGGYIYSFNGPHSLFVDTIRSCRILMLGYKLGHVLSAENDEKISLLDRALQHLAATANYAVFYGANRDVWDVAGRTAHESVFNINDGSYRCPGSQQGYSGFTTWTRGLAWAMLGFAEELEFIDTLDFTEFPQTMEKAQVIAILLKAASATCDFYIKNTPADGIPYWDTGAPQLSKLGDYLNQNADPFNAFEPVDSSAAAIGAQGLMRLGYYLKNKGKDKSGQHYFQAGLTVARRLLESPYLSTKPNHQGLILHAIYHQPNGWDYIPEGAAIPCGESCMWGDYHARELVVYIQSQINKDPYYTFFNCLA